MKVFYVQYQPPTEPRPLRQWFAYRFEANAFRKSLVRQAPYIQVNPVQPVSLVKNATGIAELMNRYAGIVL